MQNDLILHGWMPGKTINNNYAIYNLVMGVRVERQRLPRWPKLHEYVSGFCSEQSMMREITWTDLQLRWLWAMYEVAKRLHP